MGAAPAPAKAGSRGVLGQGQRPDPRVTEKRVQRGRALTSLNSWIWACSNMEKTLEEPRWACLVAVALARVPAFLLACNTVGGEGSSPGHPRAAGADSLPIPGGDLSRPLSTPPRGTARSPQPPAQLSPSWLCSGLAAQGARGPLYVSALSPAAPNKERRRGQTQTWPPPPGLGEGRAPSGSQSHS